MYRSYYHLSAKPFQISTDPRFLWLGDDHKEALANFRYGLAEGSGYVVLVGATGTGKTTLINALLATLSERVLVANINHPTLDVAEFLAFVARTYDPTAAVTSKADCLHFFITFLHQSHADGKRVLLVIDEAHRLSTEVLEETRLLSNIEQAGRKLIHIFFVGQPELLHTLRSPACRALRQRVTLFYHLQPLSAAESGKYITRRLRVAGGEERIFTDKAVQAIHALSRGYPRQINKLCDRALLTGFVKEKTLIDARTIHECAREIRLIDPMARSLLQFSWDLFAGRTWPQLTAWRAALVAVMIKCTTIGNRVRPVAAALVARMGAVARGATRAIHEIVAPLLKKNRKSAYSIAAAAVIALFMAGGIALVPLGSETAQPVVKEASPDAASEEPYILANFSVPAPPRSAGPAVIPGAGSPESLPAALPPPRATVTVPTAAAPPARPTTLRPPAALLAKQNYQAAVPLIEADGRSGAALGSETGVIYAQALADRAGELMAHSPNEAQALLRKAVAADPANTDAHLKLGLLHTRAKTYAQAIEHYQTAIRLNPQSAEAYFNLGYIYAITGMYASAEEMLEQVVALKPAYQDKALFNLSVVRQKMDKRKESLAALEAAVAVRPENQKAQAYLKELRAADPVAR
ncbi:MAG TPA: AAA family ATPase [Desulfobacterales bacterium]|nr:AAA family ATPase [Desulfobacterales bacterium]